MRFAIQSAFIFPCAWIIGFVDAFHMLYIFQYDLIIVYSFLYLICLIWVPVHNSPHCIPSFMLYFFYSCMSFWIFLHDVNFVRFYFAVHIPIPLQLPALFPLVFVVFVRPDSIPTSATSPVCSLLRAPSSVLMLMCLFFLICSSLHRSSVPSLTPTNTWPSSSVRKMNPTTTLRHQPTQMSNVTFSLATVSASFDLPLFLETCVVFNGHALLTLALRMTLTTMDYPHSTLRSLMHVALIFLNLLTSITLTLKGVFKMLLMADLSGWKISSYTLVACLLGHIMLHLTACATNCEQNKLP